MNRQERRAAERQAKANPAAGARLADQVFAQAEQLRREGRFAEAENACRQALAHDPRHGPGLNLLGILGLNVGRFDQAVEAFGRAAAAHAQNPTFHNNLGSALQQVGREAEAARAFAQAIALKPDYVRALVNLGQLVQAADPRSAEAAFRQALTADPNALDALLGLSVMLHQKGALDEARPLYERAMALAPDNAALAENHVGLLLTQGRAADAVVALPRLIKLQPGVAHHWTNLAGALEAQVRLTEAVAAYRQAILIQPDNAAAFDALGNALTNLGQIDEALAAYRRAIALAPDHASTRSNLLMTLHSQTQATAADVLAEARAYGARVGGRPTPSFANTREPERRLRIGYVCADFRVHPVGFFLERVLASHDGGQVETFLYSDTQFPDEQTERLRRHAHWRPILGQSDAQAAGQIAADRIDILIDLAGHTGFNRLAMFAARAAPVQASWLGYFGTTGVAAMDYVIGDAVVLPPGDEAVFTETPVRLASPYLCWTPPREAVSTAPFPALAGAPVTFGCFNNRAKITPQVVETWARILGRVEGSRLFLKSWSLADAGNCDGLVAAFAQHGVVGERLIFEGLSPRAEGLEAYNRVDIALDPLPFGGCTTTADTLWMGVPLVTVSGDRWSGRMSRTILESVGLDDWVAPDLDAYVDMAVSAAGDLAALAPLRASLRDRVETSPFCDGARFTANLEAEYRRMWRTWCGR